MGKRKEKREKIMDDFDQIRKSLKEATEKKSEQERLVDLFNSACAGLETGMTRGVKAELEARFDGLLGEIDERAEAVKKMIKE